MNPSSSQACPECKQMIAKPSFTKSRYTVYLCKACEVMFVDYGSEKIDLQELYGENYYRWMPGNPAEARGIKRHTFGNHLWLIEQFVKPGALLDIGCGNGFLLEEAKHRGWVPHGVEVSEYARRFIDQSLGQGIVKADISEYVRSGKTFRTITIIDAIEHFYDVDKLLRWIPGLLEPNGVVVITTANLGSWVARIMGRYWFHIKPLEHPILYSYRSMETVLKRYGMTVIDFRRHIKWMNLSYVAQQFHVYQFPGSGLVHRALKWIPKAAADRITFPMYSGEMMIIARRSSDKSTGGSTLCESN